VIDPTQTLFDQVRSSCADVAQHSSHVWIDRERLAAYAEKIDMDRPSNDPGQQPMNDEESTAAFVLTLDAINFGSGYFPSLRKRPGHSGYHTVAASLRDWVSTNGPITTESLRQQTIADWAVVFGQQLDGSPAQELMELFAVALTDLADFVDQRGEGRFSAVVEAANHCADELARSLTAMPFYRDVHEHPEVGTVALYKRAQITVQDLAVAFNHQGLGQFGDLDQLTMFADNLVPHVLRVEQVLVFDPELLAAIERGDNIAVGTQPELEIRACGVHAVELLTEAIRVRATDPRPDLLTGHLDNVLWNTGADPTYKAIPRHRSRCVFY
jgi:hypothetical protein